MPAVTIVSQNRTRTVIGNERMFLATVTVANSGDTLVVPGFKKILAAQTTPASAIVNGLTVSGVTITFLSAASNPTQLMVVGH